jgi:hypothetical protein
MAFVNAVEAGKKAPRKQRHTAHRIWCRIRAEMPEVEVGESTIWRFVRERKIQLTLIHRETFIPQSYVWGGGAFHCAFPHASQQAFLEAHERAFAYFSGVFKTLRYDNLKSAVKKILRGHQRGRRRESSPSDRTGVSSRSSAHRGKVTRRVGWKERADTFAGTT